MYTHSTGIIIIINNLLYNVHVYIHAATPPGISPHNGTLYVIAYNTYIT